MRNVVTGVTCCTLKRFTVSLIFCLITINPAFAAKETNYYSLAKQHEANGNFGTAANDYTTAAGQTDNLKRRAEIYVDVMRMFLKSNNFRGACEQMLQVKHNDPKRVISLLAKYEPQARAALLSSVSNNRSFGFPQEGMRNEEIMYFHQFFPKSRETLAEDFYKKAVEENAGYWYDLAAASSDKVAAKIVARFMGDVSKLTIEQKADSLIIVGKYIGDTNKRQAYANELLPVGKELAKKPGKEAETDKIRKALLVLMGQDWTYNDDNLPIQVEYPKGKWGGSVAPNEQTPHFIFAKESSNFSFDADNLNFMIVYEDGEVVRVWVKEDRDRSNAKEFESKRFKLVGTDKCRETKICRINIVVK